MSWQVRNDCQSGASCGVQTCAVFAQDRGWGKSPWTEVENTIGDNPWALPSGPFSARWWILFFGESLGKVALWGTSGRAFFRKHAEVTLKSLSGSWRARIHFVESRSWRTPQGTNPLAYPHFHRFVWHGVAKDFKREITYGTSNHWRATFCSNHLASCLGTDAGVRGLPYLMRYVNQPDGSSTSCREFFVLRFTGTWLTKLLWKLTSQPSQTNTTPNIILHACQKK